MNHNLFIGIFCLIIASYTDIKNREVPDCLTYALIFLSFIISIFLNYILQAIITFILTYLLGYFLYRKKVWGGGDSKMLMGIITLNANNLNFIMDFWLNLIIIGIIFYIAWHLIKNIVEHNKTMPFIPAFLAAYLFTFFSGNFVNLILNTFFI